MKFKPSDRSDAENYLFLLGAIVPRPIAFVSTVGPTGVFNLAPFSFYNGVCAIPPVLSISIAYRDREKKDTLVNIEQNREFVVNIVTEAIASAMNAASANLPPNISEFDQVGLTAVPAEIVKAPLVLESPINLECKLHQLITVGAPPHGATLVLGEVVFFHIKEEALDHHRIDMKKLKAVGRMGGEEYTRTGDLFKMKRPRTR